tara:strand:+ start:3643 stop:4113 length:471 start_codon:yes stop_codon:yes gene_type:complete
MPARELSAAYRAFVLFEVFAINIVGFLGLVFQKQLQQGARAYAARHPSRRAWEVDALRGLYWLELDATTRSGQLAHLVVAGWLGIAGLLQALIHFYPHTADEVKVVCMLTFATCDVYWLFLMYHFRGGFKWTHVAGSLATIALRAPFVASPRLMFA